MAWQEIGAGEVDANSPVSATLMGKVRNNLDWLFGQFKITLFNNSDEPEPTEYFHTTQTSQWVDVSGIRNAQIKVYCSDAVKSLKVYCRAKRSTGNNVKIRIKCMENSEVSDEYILTNAGQWYIAELTLSNPGSGLRTLQYQLWWEGGASYMDLYLHWQVVLVEEGQ